MYTVFFFSVLNHLWCLWDQLSASSFSPSVSHLVVLSLQCLVPCMFIKEGWSWSVSAPLLWPLSPSIGSPIGRFCGNGRPPAWCRSVCQMQTPTLPPQAPRQAGCVPHVPVLGWSASFPCVCLCSVCFSAEDLSWGLPFLGAPWCRQLYLQRRQGSQPFWMQLPCHVFTMVSSMVRPSQGFSRVPLGRTPLPLPWFLHPSGSNCFLPSWNSSTFLVFREHPILFSNAFTAHKLKNNFFPHRYKEILGSRGGR